jgi:hypothetical protein
MHNKSHHIWSNEITDNHKNIQKQRVNLTQFELKATSKDWVCELCVCVKRV